MKKRTLKKRARIVMRKMGYGGIKVYIYRMEPLVFTCKPKIRDSSICMDYQYAVWLRSREFNNIEWISINEIEQIMENRK